MKRKVTRNKLHYFQVCDQETSRLRDSQIKGPGNLLLTILSTYAIQKKIPIIPPQLKVMYHGITTLQPPSSEDKPYPPTLGPDSLQHTLPRTESPSQPSPRSAFSFKALILNTLFLSHLLLYHLFLIYFLNKWNRKYILM